MSGTVAACPEPSVGVYVHVPFCASRCGYCDFAAVAGRDGEISSYLEAIEAEIDVFQGEAPGEADTIFVGGGTPSRLAPREVKRLLSAVRNRFAVARGAEVTVEGNPESLTAERLAGLAEAGVTRVCVGVQSLDDTVLRRAGRPHDGPGAVQALRRARRGGFESVAADLICGLPGEDLPRFGETVRRVVDEGPDHVSVYLLETDKDTPLAREVRSGRGGPQDDEALVSAYEAAADVLEGAGLGLYEISNFARPGHESRHNLKYWRDEPYAGFGLGAHAYLLGARRANEIDLDRYLERVSAGLDPVVWQEPFDGARRAAEAVILGLRLREGVDLAAIERRYGVSLREGRLDAWERAEEAGVVEREGERARLTPGGRLRSNELFAELI